MTADDVTLRLIDKLRALAKTQWEHHCTTTMNGKWKLCDLIKKKAQVFHKIDPKFVGEEFHWYEDFEYCKDNTTTITHDCGSIQFTIEAVFHILSSMEKLVRIPKNKQIIFARDSNGNCCSYDNLFQGSPEEKYIVPMPEHYEHKHFYSEQEKFMEEMRKKRIEEFLSSHLFLFFFANQQEAA